MSFLKTVLKCLGFYLLGVLTCAVVGLTGISYFAVDQLIKASAPDTRTAQKMPVAKASMMPSLETDNAFAPGAVNPNLKELKRIASLYNTELTAFDQLAAAVAQKKAPELCATLCNSSFLDKERLNSERSFYLATYYKQEGARALQDPVFRLKLQEIGFLSRLYPPSLRAIVTATEKPNGVSKWALALRLEYAAIKEFSRLALQREELQKDAEKISRLREWTHSCQKGVNKKQVISECHSDAAL